MRLWKCFVGGLFVSQLAVALQVAPPTSGGYRPSRVDGQTFYYTIVENPVTQSVDRTSTLTVQPINGSFGVTLTGGHDYGVISLAVKSAEGLVGRTLKASLSTISSTSNPCDSPDVPLQIGTTTGSLSISGTPWTDTSQRNIFIRVGGSEGICNSADDVCTIGAAIDTSADTVTGLRLARKVTLAVCVDATDDSVDSASFDTVVNRQNISSILSVDVFPGDRKGFVKVNGYRQEVQPRWGLVVAESGTWVQGLSSEVVLKFDAMPDSRSYNQNSPVRFFGPFTGAPPGEFVVDNLINERSYEVGAFYLTEADGMDAIPANQVVVLTPSAVVGALSENKCVVATTLFGESHWVTMTLRNFRDRWLLKSPAGVWLVQGYYQVAPTWIQLVKSSEVLAMSSKLIISLTALIVLGGAFSLLLFGAWTVFLLWRMAQRKHSRAVFRISLLVLGLTAVPTFANDDQEGLDPIPQNDGTQVPGFQITAPAYSVPVSEKDKMFGVSFNRHVPLSPWQVDGAAYSYKDVYGTDEVSNAICFHHSWTWLNTFLIQAGPEISLGYAYTIGTGKFSPGASNPNNNYLTGLGAREGLRFEQFPITVSAAGKLALLKYVQPFGHFGVLAIPMLERKMGQSGKDSRKRAIGYGVSTAVGVGLWMNFLEKSAAWFLDRDWAVNDVFLTAEVRSYETFPPVRYSTRFALVGLKFEY